MKIAYIVPSLRNMGPTMVVNTIVNHLVQLGIKITVYYFDDSDSMEFRCDALKISMNKPIDFDSYDIIHSNMYRPDKYIYQWRKHIKKARLVTTIHQDIYTNLRYNYNIIVALLYTPIWLKYINIFDKKVFISNTIHKTNISNSEVIFNGVDIAYNPQIANQSYVDRIIKLKKEQLKLIGTYASINKGKGIDQLIYLAHLRKDVAIIIIGEGKEKKKLIQLVNKLKLNHRILFFPYLHLPYNYLEYIDVYAMPSRNEGFGLAMIEAAMTYTPILCSDIPVFHEIFNENQAVFFELENITSMSNALDKLYQNYDYYVTNAAGCVFSNFTGKIMAERYLKLYNNLLLR